MATRNLTARFVDSVKPLRGKRCEHFDSVVPGLALRVTEKGAKSWTVLYRHRTRLRRLTLGSAAVLDLADARERARDLLHAASKGTDPATEKQDGRRAETIGDLADLYIAKWAKPRKKSWRTDRRLLDHKVLPRWRQRAIVDITRHDVRTLVEQVAEGGAPITANRLAALLSKVFSFALNRDLVPVNPAARIPRPGQEKQRDRVLTDDEIRSQWAAFSALAPAMGAFYKLRLLTAQRGGEVVAMRWQDIDLDQGWWTIPAGDSKNKLAHRVPLSAPVVTMIATFLANADADAEFVIEGARGKRQQSEAAATFTVADFRGHDLRRTAASMMAGGGISRLTISKILNHKETGVTAVYDRYSYDAEKRTALDWWAAKLQSILASTNGTETRR